MDIHAKFQAAWETITLLHYLSYLSAFISYYTNSFGHCRRFLIYHVGHCVCPYMLVHGGQEMSDMPITPDGYKYGIMRLDNMLWDIYNRYSMLNKDMHLSDPVFRSLTKSTICKWH